MKYICNPSVMFRKYPKVNTKIINSCALAVKSCQLQQCQLLGFYWDKNTWFLLGQKYFVFIRINILWFYLDKDTWFFFWDKITWFLLGHKYLGFVDKNTWFFFWDKITWFLLG